jgi:hypothetical protein
MLLDIAPVGTEAGFGEDGYAELGDVFRIDGCIRFDPVETAASLRSKAA